MKVLIAGRSGGDMGADDCVALGLSEALRSSGHQVDRVALEFSEGRNAELRSLASLRLMTISGQCDVLVCLDIHSTILQHPLKYACPVVHGFDALENNYIGNVLMACVRECLALAVTQAIPKSLVGQLSSQAIHLPVDADFSTPGPWAPLIARIQQ